MRATSPRWGRPAGRCSPSRLPGNARPELDALTIAFATAAERGGARLVGGNVAAGPHLALTAALVGEAPGRVVTRAGASGRSPLRDGCPRAAAARAARPAPRTRRAAPPPGSRARVAHAMIDVSDGSSRTRPSLRASRAGATLEVERLPSRRRAGDARRAPAFAATAGEDYEPSPPSRPVASPRCVPRAAPRLPPHADRADDGGPSRGDARTRPDAACASAARLRPLPTMTVPVAAAVLAF
jgi:hypothetical protein